MVGWRMMSGGPQLSFTIDANLNQYIETGAAPPPGTLRELVNLRKDRDGKLVKRAAYSGTAVLPSLYGAVRGFEYDRQSVLINERAVLSYAAGIDAWKVLDRPPKWTLESAT